MQLPSGSFDFNLARGMTAAEVAEVERLVNGWVSRAQPLQTKVMALAVSLFVLLRGVAREDGYEGPTAGRRRARSPCIPLVVS